MSSAHGWPMVRARISRSSAFFRSAGPLLDLVGIQTPLFAEVPPRGVETPGVAIKFPHAPNRQAPRSLIFARSGDDRKIVFSVREVCDRAPRQHCQSVGYCPLPERHAFSVVQCRPDHRTRNLLISVLRLSSRPFDYLQVCASLTGFFQYKLRHREAMAIQHIHVFAGTEEQNA